MRARPPRPRAALVLALALALPVSSAGQSRIGSLLGARAAGAEEEHIRAELQSLGPKAVPEVLAFLAGAAEARAAPPSQSDRSLLEETLRCWPAEKVLAALHEAVRADSPLDARMLAVELAGCVHDARALRALEGLLGLFSREERSHPVVRACFEEALVECLRTDARAVQAAEALVQKRGTNEALFLPLAAALGRAGAGRGVVALQRLLGRSLELDRAVLEALGRLGPRATMEAAGVATSLLSDRLGSSDPRIRRQAAISLGRRRDGAVAEDLIGCLGDPDARVRRAAVWALEQISAVQVGDERAEWERWHDRELAWLESAVPALDEALQRGEPAPAVAALQGLALHPLFRQDLAVAAAQGLQHEDQAVALAACSVLVKLGTAGALVGLVEALEDPREAVRTAALDALRRLTGAELSESAEDWRAWLEPA